MAAPNPGCDHFHRSLTRQFAALLLTLLAASVQAQSVALSGLMGQRALLIVDGNPPKSVAPGESHRDVKLISVGEAQAVIEVAGKRQTLRLGDAPVSVGSRSNEGAENRIVLTVSSGGHFVTSGQINGQTARLMIDTGASLVVISQATAVQLGLSFRDGQQIRIGTANGTAMAWPLRLDSVRVGAVTVLGVDALVSPEPMPYVLLGNSFLSRFQMTRENDQMTLNRRF